MDKILEIFLEGANKENIQKNQGIEKGWKLLEVLYEDRNIV